MLLSSHQQPSCAEPQQQWSASIFLVAHKNKQKRNAVTVIGICGVLRSGDFMLSAVRVQVSHMLLITLPIRSAAPKRERAEQLGDEDKTCVRNKFVHIQSE